MVIVGGWFEVDPSERDAFVAERADVMLRSRAERGCIEYVIAADPVDPGRAVLFERWASQTDLDAHAAALRAIGRAIGGADRRVDPGLRRHRRTPAVLVNPTEDTDEHVFRSGLGSEQPERGVPHGFCT